MICSKCGAPIPGGMTRCPYCGAENAAAAPRRVAEDETAFADVDEGEFPADDDGKTEFAGDVWASRSEEDDKTEFAPPQPMPAAPPKAAKAPKKARPAKAPKAAKAPRQKKEKPAKEGGPNNVLRLVLVAVLVVLIILLILR